MTSMGTETKIIQVDKVSGELLQIQPQREIPRKCKRKWRSTLRWKRSSSNNSRKSRRLWWEERGSWVERVKYLMVESWPSNRWNLTEVTMQLISIPSTIQALSINKLTSSFKHRTPTWTKILPKDNNFGHQSNRLNNSSKKTKFSHVVSRETILMTSKNLKKSQLCMKNSQGP